MFPLPISVRAPRPDREGLVRRREHAAARPDFLRAAGLDVGRQAIIRRDAGQFALYTLTDGGPQTPAGTVRLDASARWRLDGVFDVAFDGELDGLLDPVAVDPDATEAQARRGEKLLEVLDDAGPRGGLVALAPHGGDIEPNTDLQAEHVRDVLADLGVSCWRCKGWWPGGSAAVRWHITSTEIDAASFPRLATIAGRGFRHAVSFHGFGADADRPEILVGGGAPDPLKREMRAAIAAAVAGTGLRVGIVAPGEPLGGRSPANLVNRLTASGRGGVQIEQQPRAREVVLPGSTVPVWRAVAAAVAGVYRMLPVRPAEPPEPAGSGAP